MKELQPYEKILNSSKEEVDKTLIPSRVKRAKAQAGLEMSKLEEEIATKEASIRELCSETEINFNGIINAQDDLELLERKLEQFRDIVDQLFPNVKGDEGSGD